MRTKLHTSLFAGALAASAAAQTTHLVGPGGFAQIATPSRSRPLATS
jgi:hypothetical protein